MYISTKEFPSAKTLNNHCSQAHPKLNLLCNIPTCTFKTKFEKDLQDHTKDKHKRVVCKVCAKITIGYAQKLHHENSVHGKESHAPAKPWVQQQKNIHKQENKKNPKRS